MSDKDFVAALRDIIREEISRALLKPPEGEKWPEFYWNVYRAVWMIPYGRVASYGAIARKAGHAKGAAQSVGNALAALGSDCRYVPWWRVVRSDGSMSGRQVDQRPLLEPEGIKFDDEGRVPERFFCDSAWGDTESA